MSNDKRNQIASSSSHNSEPVHMPGPTGFVMLPSPAKQVSVKRQELTQQMQPPNLVHFDDTTAKLRAQKAGSPTLSELDAQVHQVMQQRFENKVNEAANIYERAFPHGHVAPEHSPENIARVKLANGFKPLTVEHNAGLSPHYHPPSNKVSVMMKNLPDQLGHEMQHAYDHLSGELNLDDDTHKLHSEVRAHSTQGKVSQELTGQNPENWKGRSALQMARSYEGKVAKGYVGTLESSAQAVKKWQQSK